MWSPLQDPSPATIPCWLSSAGGNDPDDASDGVPWPGDPVDADAPTILVVDDDLANLALAEALLQAEGFKVCVAMDARSTIALLKKCSPALILMDIQLPEVDGWELTRQLKADPATRDIPVVAVTAYGKPGDDAKARESGFAAFVSKPVSTRALPDVVRRHLRR
jgi:CheY-like chemotaxis protein